MISLCIILLGFIVVVEISLNLPFGQQLFFDEVISKVSKSKQAHKYFQFSKIFQLKILSDFLTNPFLHKYGKQNNL